MHIEDEGEDEDEDEHDDDEDGAGDGAGAERLERQKLRRTVIAVLEQMMPVRSASQIVHANRGALTNGPPLQGF